MLIRIYTRRICTVYWANFCTLKCLICYIYVLPELLICYRVFANNYTINNSHTNFRVKSYVLKCNNRMRGDLLHISCCCNRSACKHYLYYRIICSSVEQLRLFSVAPLLPPWFTNPLTLEKLKKTANIFSHGL